VFVVCAEVLLGCGFAALGQAAGKAAAKILAKMALSMSSKWIPVIGAVVSGSINLWIATGVMKAAEQYYSQDFIQYDADVMKDVCNEVRTVTVT